MDLDVRMKAVMLGAVFLIVSSFLSVYRNFLLFSRISMAGGDQVAKYFVTVLSYIYLFSLVL